MRIGLFFGAGAEICYGLPSGGRFAIDLFRQDSTQYKSELRDQLRNLDAMSPYATNWLPQGYLNKRIHAFGRNEFTSLIESSIEYRKDEIIRRLNQFDSECDAAINALGIDREELSDSFERATGRRIGDSLYTQVIRLNALLSNDVQIFGSEFYSAMLDILRNGDDADDLRRYVAAFLQLLVGAHGQELVQRLNQDLFEVAPDDLPIFDDISGMFRLEFNRAGSTALELLLEESRQFDTSQDASITSLLCAIAQQVLENIFTTVLDYQKLIDDHFRYLFSPRTEWAKFTKMVIFLRTARDYIQAQSPSIENMPDGGYYHDLAEASNSDLTISAVGTANYNSLLENISHSIGLELPPVMHLNGSVRDCYNPYKNSVSISDQADDLPNEQIQVPFILTQSGLKPLTSVAMSRRYVKLFDAYRGSDAIVVVGFGFNVDDNHINGLFRELIESEGKPLYWICLANSGTQQDHQRILMRNLRLDPACRDLVRVVTVDEDRQNNNTAWLTYIASDLASPQHEGD
tara:strand:+ start:2905 stop:4458 length:1554 start_codon:yes stop_codon:yes gene_type:complete